MHYEVSYAEAEIDIQVGYHAKDNIHVATVNGEVAGFVWFFLKGAFQRSGYIRLIGVAAGYRGQGVGTALLGSAENNVFEYTENIFLLVSDFNLDAQAFYQRMGYTEIGAIPDYVKSGITELIFFKNQSPSKPHRLKQE